MKILRKLCSQQVQVLLERMDNHWEEEFYFDDSKWESVFPGGNVFKYFTKIEQKCIRDTVKKHTARWKRERAYSSILERAMSPAKTRWEYNREKEGQYVGVQAQEVARPGKILTPGLMAQQAQQVLEQEYKKAFTGTLQEHAQIHRNHVQNIEADRARQYMQNVQYELAKAHDVAELEALMVKQKFLLEHERHVIEHQQFLKQHAPRGYI